MLHMLGVHSDLLSSEICSRSVSSDLLGGGESDSTLSLLHHGRDVRPT